VINIIFFFLNDLSVVINGLFWYGFNLLLIYVVIGTFQQYSYSRVKIIEYLGQQSLGFYLWHMIPILIVGNIVTENYSFYLLSFFLVLVFFIAYRALDKIDFISKYLFGNFINGKVKNV
jgi:peptidoglycan/LPS O-acetylase OafA/YrhL